MRRHSADSGFTLIELLIVVAIIAILAAIAVPNFLEAQTRAKVSRVKSDQRSVATALEAYCVDNNAYPPHFLMGTTTPWPSADRTLARLTTPVAFITATAALLDPFSSRVPLAGGPGGTPSYFQDHQEYSSYSVEPFKSAFPNNVVTGWCIYSYGPNRTDDSADWWCVIAGNDESQKPGFLASIYDATNGTISGGDIARYGGSVPPVAGLASK